MRNCGERPRCRDRLVLALGNNGEVAAVPIHLEQPRHVSNGAEINPTQLGTIRRGAYDPAMHHVREPEILNIGFAARDLRRDVDARQ